MAVTDVAAAFVRATSSGLAQTTPSGFDRVLRAVPARVWLAIGVLVLGGVLSYLVIAVNRRILEGAGVPETIEGTAFERTAREFGTSTVAIIAKLSGYFIFILSVLVALTVADVSFISEFWNRVAVFLPKVFIAALVLIVGVVVGDKVELFVEERLRGVKLPQVSIIPLGAKYSVFYVAGLLALGQIGVNTGALVVLLGAYTLAVVLFSALAFRDLLASGAAGMFLLLNQPYGIGDRVRIGEKEGIVQEVDIFVTHVETDDEEYVVPNRRAMTDGVVRVRR